MPLRVAVLAVRPRFRQRMMDLLQADPDIEVVGEGVDRANAVDWIARCVPDVRMPDVLIMEGAGQVCADLAAAQRLQAIHPPLKVLILSIQEEEALWDAIVRVALRILWGGVLSGCCPWGRSTSR